ncbi:hypothetical protein [Moheibacter lacus]|uniref:Uncharacterized protein n=1 Tax=Moheibacter lacus TaxID=2745851 RepID=A0A838ZTM1_9FLAO|nr:hypothetical protein [Moheibacter lacus]MBA5630338.1 hypothetical protein [Moheibacter lacus]
MKEYYVDLVNVIIDGKSSEIVTITGAGNYDPNIVKNKAIELVKKTFPNAILASVILEHKFVDLNTYREITGSNPPWLYNIK